MARSQAGRAQLRSTAHQSRSQRGFCWCQRSSPAKARLAPQAFPPLRCCRVSNQLWLWQDCGAVLQGCATSQKRTEVDTPSSRSPLPAHVPQDTAFFSAKAAGTLDTWQPGSRAGGQSSRLAQGAFQTQRDIQLCQSTFTSL